MKFRIEKMKVILNIDKKNYQGYAFMDEYNNTIVQTWGENKMKTLKQYLEEHGMIFVES